MTVSAVDTASDSLDWELPEPPESIVTKIALTMLGTATFSAGILIAVNRRRVIQIPGQVPLVIEEPPAPPQQQPTPQPIQSPPPQRSSSPLPPRESSSRTPPGSPPQKTLPIVPTLILPTPDNLSSPHEPHLQRDGIKSDRSPPTSVRANFGDDELSDPNPSTSDEPTPPDELLKEPPKRTKSAPHLLPPKPLTPPSEARPPFQSGPFSEEEEKVQETQYAPPLRSQSHNPSAKSLPAEWSISESSEDSQNASAASAAAARPQSAPAFTPLPEMSEENQEHIAFIIETLSLGVLSAGTHANTLKTRGDILELHISPIEMLAFIFTHENHIQNLRRLMNHTSMFNRLDIRKHFIEGLRKSHMKEHHRGKAKLYAEAFAKQAQLDVNIIHLHINKEPPNWEGLIIALLQARLPAHNGAGKRNK